MTVQLPGWMRPATHGGGAPQHPALEALQAAIGRLSHLPTLPEAATRAMAIARDPDCSSTELAAVIERDPALAAGVLKRANSALHGAAGPVGSVPQAVVNLGLKECQNLILAVGLRSLYRKVPGPQRQRYEALWQHSLLTACACRGLGRALGLGYYGEEFACGLAHDLGRLLLGLAAPEHAPAADPMDFVEGTAVLLRERAVLGTDHCAFGAWFAKENNLPDCLVSSIRFHHTPERADEHRPLVALVAAADHLANYYQLGHGCDGYDPAASPGWPVLAAHADNTRGQPFSRVVAGVLAEALEEAAEGLVPAA